MDKSSPNTSLSSVYRLKNKLDQSRVTFARNSQENKIPLSPHQDKKNKLSVLATKIKTAQNQPRGKTLRAQVRNAKKATRKPLKLTLLP